MARNDLDRKAFGAVDGVQAVLAALRAHPTHAWVQAIGCQALNSLLCENSDTNGAAAHANGAVAVVMSALGTHQHTLTPAGTNSAPTFTGGSHTNLPPYVVTQYIIKT